jgi:CRISPR-associated endonuclease Cas1
MVYLSDGGLKATDVVNASLNYGYAILYGRIHHHALKAGLSLHISFLHTSDNTKPSLVFDMIEEFRTFVVDRVIFRLFNQNEPICVDEQGRLDEYSQKRIAKKVLDRLSTYTRYKNSKKEIDHIIADQAYLLARTIKGIAKYRAFVGRY